MMRRGHTQCNCCCQEFPSEWLWIPGNNKGFMSPDTSEHYCSKQCCELEEGDSMQNAFNLEAVNGRSVI